MNKIQSLREKAARNQKKIILPESDDLRIIEAASIASKEKIASISMLGKRSDVEKRLGSKKLDLNGIEFIDPENYPRKDEIINTYYELRKAKGITPEDARKQVFENLVHYGALMGRLGMVDGFVAGASHSTADVARAALYSLGLDPKIGALSSSFVVEIDNCPYGEDGLMVYGDCGVIPDPVPNQLAGIAIACGELIEVLFDVEPKVALLSYSTKGSAKGKSIDKVISALNLVKERAPHLKVDGELQGDSALVPEVAAIKCKGSEVAGKANVLIFPNLDAGNICYKLTQRLAKARVVGPLLMGTSKPASDLSRGCGVEEVVDAITITAVRAQRNAK